MEKREKTCTCPFDEDTAREIGHRLDCPRRKDKTWWQEKKIEWNQRNIIKT